MGIRQARKIANKAMASGRMERYTLPQFTTALQAMMRHAHASSRSRCGARETARVLYRTFIK